MRRLALLLLLAACGDDPQLCVRTGDGCDDQGDERCATTGRNVVCDDGAWRETGGACTCEGGLPDLP